MSTFVLEYRETISLQGIWSFQYDPLGDETRSFRFLRLNRGREEAIEYEIFEAYLDGEDTIPFEALSYVWGSLETPVSMKLSRNRLNITTNLHIALQHLRLELQDRTILVDAICVDRKNLRERGYQVQQIGNIYSRAEQVIFWLVRSTPEIDLVFRTLGELEQLWQEHSGSSWLLSDRSWLSTWRELQLDWTKHATQAIETGFQQLLDRAWFRRVWILQEVANPRRAFV
jgi:hypothetical protein